MCVYSVYCILATTPWWLTMKRIEEWKEQEPHVIDSIDQYQHLTKWLTKPSVVWLFWLFLIPNDMATVCQGGVTTTVTPQWPMWLAQDHCSDSSLSPPLSIPPFIPMFRPHSCQVLSPSMFLSCNYPIVIVQAWKFWWNHRLQKYTLVFLIIVLFFQVLTLFCYFPLTTLSIKKLFLREACASEISSGRDALIRSHLSGESHGKATSGFPRTGLLPQQRTRSQFWSCNCNSEQSQSRSWCKGC